MVVTRSFAILTLLSASRLAGAAQSGNHGVGNSSLTDRIKNVVVLIQENRSFDSIVGDFSYSGDINGLLHTEYCNPVNVTDPTQGTICATPTAPNVAADDPNHSISGDNMELFSTFHPSASSKETMQGFVYEQAITFRTTNVTRAAEAIEYYSETNLPTLRTLSEEFVLFDEWFCAVPGPTNPNRAYLTSGTSHGHGSNDNAFNIAAIPVRSVFQQLSEYGVSWINYYNSSFAPDALFYNWTVSSGAATTNVKPLTQFFTDAKAGTLPQFSYINPECCSFQSFHPPSPIYDGQIFVKTVYEALRASPQWANTLFILTFDENGGFADHVPPPIGVPPGDNLTYTETAPDGVPFTFDFTRLGVRVPAWLISPWVGKSVIEHKGKNNGHVYTHTSILAFLANLWGLDFLTPRVAFSSTFERLILEKPRDTPQTLPLPVPF
ncbi:phosphoesterase [Tricholoma matsutake]|nr:phosphoesterase [Tricholoma matsutake 945]